MLLLGGIGIFLPVWPTTPFVLLAAGCFSSNPRLSEWLMQNRFFGAYIVHYRQGVPVAKAVIIKSLVFLWGMLGVSAVMVGKSYIWVILLVVGIAVSCHLLVIMHKSKRRALPPTDDPLQKESI